jgi:hypothetical protein
MLEWYEIMGTVVGIAVTLGSFVVSIYGAYDLHTKRLRTNRNKLERDAQTAVSIVYSSYTKPLRMLKLKQWMAQRSAADSGDRGWSVPPNTPTDITQGQHPTGSRVTRQHRQHAFDQPVDVFVGLHEALSLTAEEATHGHTMAEQLVIRDHPNVNGCELRDLIHDAYATSTIGYMPMIQQLSGFIRDVKQQTGSATTLVI